MRSAKESQQPSGSAMSFGGGDPGGLARGDQAVGRGAQLQQNIPGHGAPGSQSNLGPHDSTDALLSQLQNQGLESICYNDNFMSSLIDDQIQGSDANASGGAFGPNRLANHSANAYAQPNPSYIERQ